MALCQISHYQKTDLLAKLSADVRADDVSRVGCSVRVAVGDTGGAFVIACGNEIDAAMIRGALCEVLK